MLAHVGPERIIQRKLSRPPNVESHVARLKVCGSKHLPIPSETQLRCHICKAKAVTQKVFVKCHWCEVGLCDKRTCFEDYHTKAQH